MTKQRRVLLVEDEEIILADLSRTLEKQGYEIAGTALSGSEAVLVAASVQPDVVLMDVQLQGRMDGLEAARQIRQTRPGADRLPHRKHQYTETGKSARSLQPDQQAILPGPTSRGVGTCFYPMKCFGRRNGLAGSCQSMRKHKLYP